MKNLSLNKSVCLIAFLLVVSCLIAPVLAYDYQGTFTAPLAPAAQILPNYATIYTSSIPQWNVAKWRTNTTSAGTPISLIWYYYNDYGVTGYGTFIINNTATGQDYATGTLYAQNGTNMYGTNKQYWYLEFSSYNSTGLSGMIAGYLRVTSWNGERYNAANNPSGYLFSSDMYYTSNPESPMGVKSTGAPDVPMLNNGGALYTKQSDVVEYDYEFTKLTGYGNNQIVCATFIKVNNNILNSVAIFNATNVRLVEWNPSTSGIDTGMIVGSDWRISTKVNGLYYNGTDVFYPFSGTPTPTPTPTVSPTNPYTGAYNLTVAVRNGNGYAPVNNAFVEFHRHDIYDSINSGYTNASGMITYQGMTAAAGAEIRVFANGFQYYSMTLQSTPTSDTTYNIYLDQIATPTPTPLPVNTGNYTLAIAPTAVQNGGTAAATIASAVDPTLAQIQQVEYLYNDGSFYEIGSTSKALHYVKIGGAWYGWDSDTFAFSNSKGATIPNPADLIFSGSTGTKTVTCYITLTNGIQYQLTGTVVVGAGTNWITTNVHAVDGLSGGQLWDVEIDILNENTGAWKNGTYYNGQASITTTSGTYLSFYGYLAGYVNASSLHKIAITSPSYPLRFYESGISPGTGNQTFYVTVEDQSGNPLSNALVTITEVGLAAQSKSTPTEGTVSFVLNQSSVFTYRVTKTGYGVGAGSFSTDASSIGSIHVQLTLLTTVTPTVTVPTIIPTNAAGNYTGFWGPIANAGQAMGATPDLIPLLMASLLVFIGFCVGGWSGAAYSPGTSFNGQVSMVGGIFGFVLSCLFGFIPIVWIISIIVLGVFFFIFFARG